MPQAPSVPLTSHPVWDLVSKIAAPGALGVGASCYLTGFTFRTKLLTSFGFGVNAMSHSVQDTIAFGYPLLMLALFFCILVVMIAQAIELMMVDAVRKYAAAQYFITVKRRIGRAFSRPLILFMLVLSIGFFAGSFAGIAQVNRTKSLLRNHCISGCFLYRTKRGSVIGRMVMQDSNNALIAGKNSSYLIKVGDILGAQSTNGKAVLAGWK